MPAAINGVSAPPEATDKPTPISVGKSFERKPASGKPVSGFVVSDPPWALASA
jgi:hypothetical protein